MRETHLLCEESRGQVMLYLGPRPHASPVYCSQRKGKADRDREVERLTSDKSCVRKSRCPWISTPVTSLSPRKPSSGATMCQRWRVSTESRSSQVVVTRLSRHCRPVCCPGASHHQHLPLHHRDHPPHPLRPQERVRQAGESDVETEQGQVCSNSNSSCCQWQVNLLTGKNCKTM